METIKEF